MCNRVPRVHDIDKVLAFESNSTGHEWRKSPGARERPDEICCASKNVVSIGHFGFDAKPRCPEERHAPKKVDESAPKNP
jgi:hypothetical protein